MRANPPLHRSALAAALVACVAAAAPAQFAAEVDLTNPTGQDKANWPVFLTVYKVFGGNLPAGALNAKGFHVIDPAGRELPHLLRRMPPETCTSSDEIVFVVAKMPAGGSMTLRVTNDKTAGKTAAIDLAGNPNNLLPNGGFEAGADGEAPGYAVTAAGGAALAYDTGEKRSGRRSLRLALPAGGSCTLKTAKPVQFRKGCPYHFSLWGRTENVAYNGYGFRGAGCTVSFAPAALRGRASLTLRGDRPWYCYRFEPGGRDDWGVPLPAARVYAETVRRRGRNAPAEIWARAGGKAHLVIAARQDRQPFLRGDNSGRVWLDEALLFEQPEVTVERRKPVALAARRGMTVYARPVNSPRWGPFAHEAVKKIEAFAMRGERRQVRFGIYAAGDLANVTVFRSPLVGPAGRLEPEHLDLEMYNQYVEPYREQQLKAGEWAEYLLAFDVPRGTKPGTYRGALTIRSGGGFVTETVLPVALEVLPVTVPDMKGYWVGGVYNVGYDLPRDDAFYRTYGKVGFNYLMLFDYLVAQMKGDRLDFDAADRQVERIVKLARVTGGIGLYREPNISEDEPRKFYQIAAGKPDWAGDYKIGTDAKFRAGYQALCRRLDEHGKAKGWPTLIYMVSDEPGDRRDVDASMGWLNEALPKAITCCDAQFRDLLRTWQWYNLPILDDPTDWTGPLVYEFVKAREKRFGICGTAWSVDTARYQPGYMLPATGACYWHFWHTQGPFDRRQGRVDRRFFVAAMAAGVNDLRYYVALKQRMAKRTSATVVEAEKYLHEVLAVIPGDHDRHLLPYNGVPWQWGYDRFYDDWRAEMKDYILRLEGK